MGPQEFFSFDQPRNERRHEEESENQPEREERETENPYIQPLGELGSKVYFAIIDHFNELRKERPMIKNNELIRSANSKFDLRGPAWKMALEWATKSSEVTPAKELPTTIRSKNIKAQSNLRKLGGNRHIDDAANNDK